MMMIPREHGAYGQLLFPLVTAVAIGRPSAAALLLGGAAVALFVAHEPVLVMIGRRGAAAQRVRRREAVTWLIGSVSAAAVLGALAIVWLPAAARWTVAVPAVAAAAAALFVARGHERTTAGEIVVAAALASVSFPVAIAASATTIAALTCALAYTAVFIAATVSVRAVIGAAFPQRAGIADATRTTQRWGGRYRSGALMIATLAFAAVAALALQRVILPAAVVAALPMSVVAVALVVLLPPPRYLRRIGWTLVGATALTGIILVAAIR